MWMVEFALWSHEAEEIGGDVDGRVALWSHWGEEKGGDVEGRVRTGGMSE